jgi:hypothetical protein
VAGKPIASENQVIVGMVIWPTYGVGLLLIAAMQVSLYFVPG